MKTTTSDLEKYEWDSSGWKLCSRDLHRTEEKQMSEDRDQSALLCDGSENRSQNNGSRISQVAETRWHSDEQTQARGPKPDLWGRLCLDGK
jgi:hypothetical protein